MKFKLVESKEDIKKFVDKFGKDTYEEFKKSTQRLKNAGMSTDILVYVKDEDMTKSKLDKILFNLKNRIQTKDDTTELAGEYKYLGEGKGYKVYQPLDALASMNLGVGTGWCTTGRYGHAGEKNCKPSESDAKEHFEDYTSKGIDLYYFLDSKTMEGEYAIALYPITLEVDQFINNETYIESTNFEIFNKEDKIDYNAIEKLPIDLIPKLEIESHQTENGVLIDGTKLIKAKKDIKKVEIPNSVTIIGVAAFYKCKELKDITIPNSVKFIEGLAFTDCIKIKKIIIPESVEYLGLYTFSGCSSLESITLKNNKLKQIEQGTFEGCYNLRNIEIPDSVNKIKLNAFDSCNNLGRIDIPNSVKEIEKNEFKDCNKLTIYCPKGSYAEEYAKENDIPYKNTITEEFINEKLEPLDPEEEDLSDSDILISQDPYDIKKYLESCIAMKLLYLPAED